METRFFEPCVPYCIVKASFITLSALPWRNLGRLLILLRAWICNVGIAVYNSSQIMILYTQNCCTSLLFYNVSVHNMNESWRTENWLFLTKLVLKILVKAEYCLSLSLSIGCALMSYTDCTSWSKRGGLEAKGEILTWIPMDILPSFLLFFLPHAS